MYTKKKHKGTLNLRLTQLNTDSKKRNRFREKLPESGKGVTNFTVYLLVKNMKTKETAENIPKN